MISHLKAMKPLLYGSSPEVTTALHNCMLHLLPVLDAYHTDVPAKVEYTIQELCFEYYPFFIA